MDVWGSMGGDFTEKYTLKEKSCDDSVKLVSHGTSERDESSEGKTGINSCDSLSQDDCSASTLFLIGVQERP